MKITFEETISLLRKRLNVPASMAIEIDLPPPPQGMNYCEAVAFVYKKYPHYLTNEKIPAIKELCSLVVNLGLAEAKVAVENPILAIGHYAQTKTFLNHTHVNP